MSNAPTPPASSGGSSAQAKAQAKGLDVDSIKAEKDAPKNSSVSDNEQAPKESSSSSGDSASKADQAKNSAFDKLGSKGKDAKDYVDIASGRGYQGPNTADHGTEAEKKIDQAGNAAIKKAAAATPVTQAAERGVSIGKDLIKKKADEDPDSVAATMVRASRTAKRGVLGALVLNELFKIAALYALLQMIKGLLVKLLMAVLKLAQFVANFFIAIGKGLFGALGAGFMAGAQLAAGILGVGSVGGIMAMGATSVIGLGALTGLAGTAIDTVREDQTVRSDLVSQCLAQLEVAATNNSSTGPVTETGETANAKVETVKNAKMIYSVMKADEYPDVVIAAALGNFSKESGVDPTSIEAIYDEPFRIGPKKKAAIESDYNLDVYAPGVYAGRPVSIVHSGIGYGQWTNDRNRSLLAFAKKMGKDWYQADVQMAFMLTADDQLRRNILSAMKSMGNSSVEDATDHFMRKWEGISDSSVGARIDAAKYWYIEMADWTVDPNAKSLLDEAIEKGGGSVVDSVESSKTEANRSAVDRIADSCKGEAGAGSLANSVSAVWDGDLGDGEWTNPCPGCVVISPFGPRFLAVDAQNGNYHWGWDMGRQDGSIAPIIAPTEIKITDMYAADGCIFGRATDSDVGFGFCHMASFDVKIGDTVPKGTVLGTEGAMIQGNPNGTIPHLHFEMYKPGSPFENFGWFNDRSFGMDPKPAFESKGVDIFFQ